MAVCFLLFLAMVAACLAAGLSVAWGIFGGLLLFGGLALSRGYSLRRVWAMAWSQGRKTILVLRILVLIGVITGLWRASGTIAICVWYGVKLITPSLFLLVTFLITALMSYALGTSFGVVGTAGVIFMALARSGGVDEVVTAGVLLSGIYFGDRCSPASSSASLVAAVTETALYDNVKLMLRTGALPLLLVTGIYVFLSLRHPLAAVDGQVLEALSGSFRLTPWVLVPALVMLVLPLLRVPILPSMGVSILASAVLAVAVQGFSPLQVAEIALLGYHPAQGPLAEILSGGGAVSMFTTLILVPLTGLYTGILDGIGALRPMERRAEALTGRWGRLPVTAATAVLCAAVFCNQAVAVMLTQQITGGCYADRRELAQDIENTAILFAGLIPWSIACAIPLSVMGVGYGAVAYGFLLWVIPLCYFFTKHWFFGRNKE